MEEREKADLRSMEEQKLVDFADDGFFAARFIKEKDVRRHE